MYTCMYVPVVIVTVIEGAALCKEAYLTVDELQERKAALTCTSTAVTSTCVLST